MRKLDDWLTAYMAYVEETESALIFHRWVALSLVAGALRKKTWFHFGRTRIYSNLYIVLVADPGVARKTQAISYGSKILAQVPSIVLSADSTTREALMDDIESAASPDQMPDGDTFTHSSLFIVSREFESFIGTKKENSKMITMLTDLYDCEELPVRYRTRHSTSNVIPAVFLHMLAATTPSSITNFLPLSAIGGGLSSRICFPWASDVSKKVPVPEDSTKVRQLGEELAHDLSIIARILGSYSFSKEARREWDNWYNKYDMMNPLRICKDPAFTGWYSRKPTLVIKLAMICTASKTNSQVVQWEEFVRAIAIVEDLERSMGNVFSGVGRSEIAPDVDLVLRIIRERKLISEHALMALVWRDVDKKKFDNVITTAISQGAVKREYTDPNTGKPGIWYKWIAKEVF
jgi:hypothetical protein